MASELPATVSVEDLVDSVTRAMARAAAATGNDDLASVGRVITIGAQFEPRYGPMARSELSDGQVTRGMSPSSDGFVLPSNFLTEFAQSAGHIQRELARQDKEAGKSAPQRCSYYLARLVELKAITSAEAGQLGNLVNAAVGEKPDVSQITRISRDILNNSEMGPVALALVNNIHHAQVDSVERLTHWQVAGYAVLGAMVGAGVGGIAGEMVGGPAGAAAGAVLGGVAGLLLGINYASEHPM
ncbi:MULTISPECIES: hypothetical protein [unclassified Streptomyces]|uniref:hypothetical protein n=1 Tax=unclassified Streptomyces TaxID=2593676 RepID=UPI00081DD9DC|nr:MULTISPECIES: hypothetical protein [unclassified Streptomyces]MYZ36943.1 hypothetical protein [Streptomyces sp. SID4917]SCF87472.1 hypothetical protein GA0115259_104019 [Streptomyces sp. MnatMP-M17]